MRPAKGVSEGEDGIVQASLASIFAFTNKKDFTVLIPALLLTTLAGAVKPTITIFLGRIFDELSSFGAGSTTKNELLQNVSVWSIALACLGISTIVVNGGFFSLWLIFGEMQARSVRDKAFISMLGKEIEWYDLREDGIGSLLVRIQTQARELQIATSQPLGFFIEDAAAAIAALGIAFYNSWNLTLVILAFVPVTVVTLAIVTRKIQPAIDAQKRDLSRASKYAHSAIAAVDTVKVFNGQDQEVWQYASAVKKAARSYMVQAFANSLQMGITRFMTTGIFVVGFWYGIVLVRHGLGPGSVLTTFYSCLMATEAAEALLPQWLVLSKGMSAGETLRYLLLQMKTDWRVSKIKGVIKPTICHGDVEVSNVSFSYPSNFGHYAIRNASFFFPAGETTFVIGKSGCGKSTICNLLMKFYNPSCGDLLVDGHSIQTLDLDWLRNNISLVQQECVLFNETMFRNIALGRRKYTSVSRDDMKMACHTAMLQQTISDLPEGLDTMIGMGGNSLSGGQKQRVVIARARLRDSPILILDEATSALDHVSRSLVMEAIRRWRRGRTTIIITHDTSEIQKSDYVYVLDAGRVVQEGYRYQFHKQLEGPFMSLNRNNVKDPFSDGAAEIPSMELVASSHTEKSISEPRRMDRSGDAWPRISRSSLVSQLFGLNDKVPGKEHSNNRGVFRGRGMSSVYANALRVNNVMGPSILQPFPEPFDTPIHNPPLTSTMISRGGKHESYLSRHDHSDEESVSPGIYESKGKSRVKSPLEAAGFGSSQRSHSSGCLDPNPNMVPHLAPNQMFHQSQKKVNDLTNSHMGTATMSQILRTVWPNLVAEDRIALILGFINAFISAASTPAFSYVLARLLGTFNLTSGQTGKAEMWALVILAIAVVDGISCYYMHYFLEYCGQAWVDTLRVEALNRILAQPKAWFDKPQNNSGRLDECLDRNTEEMRNLVGRFAGYVFLAGSMMSIAIVWAFIVCWKLTLIGLASGPFMYAFTRTFEAVSGRWGERQDGMSEAIGSIFFETFSNIKTVRALTLENYFTEKHTMTTIRAYNVGMHRAAYMGFFFGLSDSTNSFVIALILYYGAAIAASGDWSVESVLQVITLLLFSSGNANSVIALIPQISSSRTTATNILYLANMPKKASHESNGSIYLPSPLPVNLNSLSFTYPSQPTIEILHKISTSFPANSCTAIVGPSGSGKSTVASLLLGLYPPTEPLNHPTPSITFADTSIFACNMAFLRGQMAFVSQTPILFPLTIAENITYGLHGHSPLHHPRAVQAAARAAGIHDFITSLPRGYDTPIGDGGQGLSGGQAQRIAIARALIRRPRILIMDEPTSALDSDSARLLRATISRLVKRDPPRRRRPARKAAPPRPDMAVILITHSVDMMRVASRIVVLERGRVVQEGRFEELAARDGPFSRLISGVR